MDAGKEANQTKTGKKPPVFIAEFGIDLYLCDQWQLIYFIPDNLSSISGLCSRYTTSLSQSLDQVELKLA